MPTLESLHRDHGASFRDCDGRSLVEDYGRPDRAHLAVRNGVGFIEAAYDILRIEGDDRIEYVDNVVSNRVPTGDGHGCLALLLDPQGAIELQLTIFNAGDHLLVFTPPGRGESLLEEWRDRVFIQDVSLELVTDSVAVLGVHGPAATEKIASVLSGATPPEDSFTFVRGSIDEVGVTVARLDAPTGEEGFEVACPADGAGSVFTALQARGVGAAPFGHRTWSTLTLEAGTPQFETELEGRIPNLVGLRSAVDFEKGCFVGQEVVSRVENRGQPSQRLVGLTIDDGPTPDSGAAVFDGDAAVGSITRAVDSPSLERPIAFAIVDYDLDTADLSVRVNGAEVPAERTSLPFVSGSERSARLPEY